MSHDRPMTSRTEPDGASAPAGPGAPGDPGDRRPTPTPTPLVVPRPAGGVPIPVTPGHRRTRRRVLLVVLVLVVLGLAATGWIYFRASQANAALRVVGNELSDAQAAVAQ